MKDQAKEILKKELGLGDFILDEVAGLGKVNKVYTVASPDEEFILRLNDEAHNILEYRKEQWCIDAVTKLGVPSPTVLKIGIFQGVQFMLQQRLPGINGSHALAEEKLAIWQDLGAYARVFQQVPQIADTDVEGAEFHASWKHRLRYNIGELNESDSLLSKGIVSSEDHFLMKEILAELGKKQFATGLVHGDLCPRNTIWQAGKTFLIDWGTAGINIVPHNEIGLVLLSGEANHEEFKVFLEGLGLDDVNYKRIEPEVRAINFLHHLDKYRWAEGHAVENIGDFGEMVVATFQQVNK